MSHKNQSTAPVGEWALRLVAVAGLGLLVLLSTKLVMKVVQPSAAAVRSSAQR